MNENTSSGKLSQSCVISPAEAARLEAEGLLLRILKPDIKRRLLRSLDSSPHEIQPYVATSGEQVYISFARIGNEAQRQQANFLIRQYQVGAKVDLGSLPAPLHRLLQPDSVRPGFSSQVLALGGIAGVVIGILAMAVSILATAATELLFQVSLNEFSGIQITAVAFVIFAVIGWLLATIYLWRRLK